MNEQKLKKLIRRGDRKKAFLLIYDCFPAVKKAVRCVGGSAEDAEDVFQDAVISLYKRMNEHDFFPDKSISAYLQKAAKNLYFKKIHRDIREEEAGRALWEDTGRPEETEEDLMEKVTQKALHEIGSPCAELLDNFYVKKWSMHRIAEKMGYASAASAKARKYKCLEKVREKAKLFFNQIVGEEIYHD